ncbi:MAG: hypothetical protein Q7T03_03505 [Deltaproteobacteria bacterium]|nr:hypothetical protein [Deltaproteobacteria bacterium]
MKRITAIAVVVSLFGSACATTYTPQPSAFIKSTSKGYEKCDQIYKRGMFNQGIVRATEGDPEAQVYAKKSSRNQKWSWGLVGGSLAALGAGIGLEASNDRYSTAYKVGNGLIWTAIVSALVSIVPSAKSPSQAADAINKYNDNVLLKSAADACPNLVEKKSEGDMGEKE